MHPHPCIHTHARTHARTHAHTHTHTHNTQSSPHTHVLSAGGVKGERDAHGLHHLDLSSGQISIQIHALGLVLQKTKGERKQRKGLSCRKQRERENKGKACPAENKGKGGNSSAGNDAGYDNVALHTK